jgi:hypothetical protein
MGSIISSYLDNLPEHKQSDAVSHPEHYGGKDNTYEAIKVIEAWSLNFCLGNVVKYLSRAGKKGSKLEDLKKAQWYLNREIEKLEKISH